MSSSKPKTSASDPASSTSPPGNVDRRGKPAAKKGEQQPSARVRFDDKGNTVFEIRTDTPRRRKDDDTVDLLKCLDNDSLSLAEDDE